MNGCVDDDMALKALSLSDGRFLSFNRSTTFAKISKSSIISSMSLGSPKDVVVLLFVDNSPLARIVGEQSPEA